MTEISGEDIVLGETSLVIVLEAEEVVEGMVVSDGEGGDLEKEATMEEDIVGEGA